MFELAFSSDMKSRCIPFLISCRVKCHLLSSISSALSSSISLLIISRMSSAYLASCTCSVQCCEHCSLFGLKREPGWIPAIRPFVWIRPSQTDLSSDHPIVRSKLRLHLKCARKIPLIRLMWARICLWLDLSAVKIVLSENGFEHEKISQYCYSIFISWKMMFYEIYSTKEKPILKVLQMNRNPKCRKKCYWLYHNSSF